MEHDPKRLQEQDDRLGRALRTARASLPGPGPQALARVQQRLEGRRARPRAWALQLASAAALFLLVASAAAGTTYGIQVLAAWQRESVVVPPPIPEPPPAPPRRPEPARVIPAIPERTPEPSPEPSLVPAPVPEPAVAPTRATPRRPASSNVAPETPETPETPRPLQESPAPRVAQAPVESSLAAESRVLGTALRQLRQERDANRALETLDRLRAEHPTGSLVDEADFARIEALTSLGRADEALREVERLEPRLASGSVRRAQLVLLRGELLAGAGRFSEALPFFDELVAGGGATLERALFGRATARSHLGDLSGSRADLQRCLELFPQGAFAERARTALAR